MEKQILAALLSDRDAYEQLKSRLTPERFSDAGGLVLKEILHYYHLDPNAGSVDKDIIKDRLSAKFSKKADLFVSIVDGLGTVSIPNILEQYFEHERRFLSEELATELMANGHTDRAQELIDLLTSVSNDGYINDEEVFIATDIHTIIEPHKPENLIQIDPPILNIATGGGVIPGTHIVVFARPEVGKTLFSINLAAHFLEQGEKVLYIGNEDPAPAMQLRFINRLTGLPKNMVMRDPDKAYRKAMNNGYSNLVFVGKGGLAVRDVGLLAEKYEPDVIVVDQMRNLKPDGNKLGRVEALEYIARELRDIYKSTNGVGVSLTQAGDSAENKLQLDQGDVDFSNTGIPATADLMIGIGANEDFKNTNRRCITFCKNKINANHGSYDVRIIPELTEVQDI